MYFNKSSIFSMKEINLSFNISGSGVKKDQNCLIYV